MAAVVGALLVPSTAASASAAEVDLDLGPQITKTDTGPTGYSVTFRYDAPDDAESVRIFGDWQFSSPDAVVDLVSAEGRFGKDWRPGDIVAKPGTGFLLSDMTKGDDGVWTWTTPLPSGTYSYHFVHEDCAGPSNVGCTRILDPANPNWSQSLEPTGPVPYSTIYVPENPLFPTYDLSVQAPTPPERTGSYEHREYDSPTSTAPPGKHELVAYLPAGYDPDREVPYPTLYISHGAGGGEATWNVQGLSNFIMENLVAEGVVQPMVIVSTNFYGLPGEISDADFGAAYSRDLIDNVIPFIEREYNVSTDPADRAMSGQSAGGAVTLDLLYNHASEFEYFGAWAAGGGASGVLPSAAQVDGMRTIRGGIHMGTGLQDFLANINANSQARVDYLQAAGIDVDEYNLDGDHQWPAARKMYEDFLRNVAFRATTTDLTITRTGDVVQADAVVAPLGTPAVGPEGDVEFLADGEVIGTAPVQADGRATLRLDVGDQPAPGALQTRYVGNRLFDASTSALLEVTETLDIDLSATSTVSNGRTKVTIVATNNEDVAAGIAVVTPYGTVHLPSLKAGATVTKSITLPGTSIPSGTIGVKLKATVDGREISLTEDVAVTRTR